MYKILATLQSNNNHRVAKTFPCPGSLSSSTSMASGRVNFSPTSSTTGIGRSLTSWAIDLSTVAFTIMITRWCLETNPGPSSSLRLGAPIAESWSPIGSASTNRTRTESTWPASTAPLMTVAHFAKPSVSTRTQRLSSYQPTR